MAVLVTSAGHQVDRPIAAVLSLNTIANTGGGALAGALAGQQVRRLERHSSMVFTPAIPVFAEL